MKFHTNQIVKMTDSLDNRFHNQHLLGQNMSVVRYINFNFEGFPTIKVLDANEFTWYVSEKQIKLVE